VIIITDKDGLKSPEEFYELSEGQISDISNGCGPKGWGFIVPDRFRLLGIDFAPACDRHDFCYHIGMPKKDADNLFLENMLTIASKAWLPQVAERFAFIYYLAVKNGGAGAYNRSGKE
jgi:hypothetical protein